jgi:ADP-ribosylglycohydrolase
MRSAIVGAFFSDDPERRRRFASALAEVTHTDPRAVQGAVFVAEVAAVSWEQPASEASPGRAVSAAMPVVTEPALLAALQAARGLAERNADTTEAAATLGTSGFVLHTVPFATFCFLTAGREPLAAIVRAVSAGGDTDSIGAIVGAWVGALHGAASLPSDLLARIQDGPFGPTHLRALGRWLSAARRGEPADGVCFSAPAAFARNVALLPVILGHGFRRLLPF